MSTRFRMGFHHNPGYSGVCYCLRVKLCIEAHSGCHDFALPLWIPFVAAFLDLRLSQTIK